MVDPESEAVVAAETDDEARRLALLLEAVGFRRFGGLLAGGVSAWRDAGLEVESTPAIDVPELAVRLRAGDVRLLDVRELDEWEEGHVQGSRHLPYHELGGGIPPDLRNGGKPLAVALSVGNRSAIAVSLLRRAGVDDVIHVVDGGVAELAGEGIELVRPNVAGGKPLSCYTPPRRAA